MDNKNLLKFILSNTELQNNKIITNIPYNQFVFIQNSIHQSKTKLKIDIDENLENLLIKIIYKMLNSNISSYYIKTMVKDILTNIYAKNILSSNCNAFINKPYTKINKKDIEKNHELFLDNDWQELINRKSSMKLPEFKLLSLYQFKQVMPTYIFFKISNDPIIQSAINELLQCFYPFSQTFLTTSDKLANYYTISNKLVSDSEHIDIIQL